jgi:hypothetical protein
LRAKGFILASPNRAWVLMNVDKNFPKRLLLIPVLLIVTIVSADILFFRNLFWDRLLSNIVIFLVYFVLYLVISVRKYKKIGFFVIRHKKRIKK